MLTFFKGDNNSLAFLYWCILTILSITSNNPASVFNGLRSAAAAEVLQRKIIHFSDWKILAFLVVMATFEMYYWKVKEAAGKLLEPEQ